jgi:2-haloacid dehalogenase
VSRVSAVVWDLGNVLIEWDPRRVFRPELGSDAAVEEFLAEVDFTAWNHAADAGRPIAAGLAEAARRWPHRVGLLEAYVARFPETMVGPVAGSVELLAELRRRGEVRLLALTNWSAETFPHARAAHEFLSWFEVVVVSGEEGVAKPDEQLFRRLVQRHGLDPATTVFIDDGEANVAAAARVGLRALRFTTPERLRADLAALGLVDRDEAGGGS